MASFVSLGETFKRFCVQRNKKIRNYNAYSSQKFYFCSARARVSTFTLVKTRTYTGFVPVHEGRDTFCSNTKLKVVQRPSQYPLIESSITHKIIIFFNT